jgi:thiamine kinase-like enzyme
MHVASYGGEAASDDMQLTTLISTSALQHICGILKCLPRDIANVCALKKGHTNTSYLFDVTVQGVASEHYIYREPGTGTEKIIDREREAFAQRVADNLGLDGTTIALNAAEGWKLSRFILGATDFSYRNPEQVKQACGLLRHLHDAAIPCPWNTDVAQGNIELHRLLREQGIGDCYDLGEIEHDIDDIQIGTDRDGVAKVLCHNDACDTNFLVTPGEMRLIDWEYGGRADPGTDLASFICGVRHTDDEVAAILTAYFGHMPTESERRHVIGCIALYCYHWLLWAEYRETQGMVGNHMPAIWADYAKEYVPLAHGLYRN